MAQDIENKLEYFTEYDSIQKVSKIKLLKKF